MSRVAAFLHFLWDFVVGDDWRIAVAVVIAIAATALIGSNGWLVLPIVVIVVLSYSVYEVARSRRS